MNTKILILLSLFTFSCNSATSGSDAGPDTGTASLDARSPDSASPTVDTGPSQPPVDAAGTVADAAYPDAPGDGSVADVAVTDGPGDGSGADVASSVDTAQGGMSACGVAVCPAGKVCCNPVMGICTQPGGVCVQ